MAKDWKDRLGVVFSTDPDFDFNSDNEQELETLSPAKQKLKVQIDRKHRKGKIVTLVTGFVGKEDDLKILGKLLKTKCGVGGSVKNGEIILQGEWLDKVKGILDTQGFHVK